MQAVKRYSKLISWVFLTAACFHSCGNKNTSSIKIFNLYNTKDSLIKSKIFVQRIFEKDSIDSIVIINNDTIMVSFTQIEDRTGIFRFCGIEKIKTHSFFDSSITEFCRSKPPFINRNVSFRGYKNYLINGNEYQLFHFIENTGNHTTYDSYYLKGVGFICYYSFDKDNYILCDSIEGFTIKNEIIKKINARLLIDTSFFARFILKKSLPDYFRPFINNREF